MMKRRSLLATLPALALAPPAFAANAEPGVGPREILLGQTADLSASRAAITRSYSEGARLYFELANRNGGVHGRQIRVVQVDDAYQVPRAMANAKALVEERQVFALVHSVGTGIAEKLVPWLEQAGVPHIHPLTGADQVRPPQLASRQTFFLRASYRREVEKIVRQLKTLGITRIALVHEDEPFGQGIHAQAQALVREHGLALAAVGVLPFNKPGEVGDAVNAVAAAAPTAVIVGSAGPSVEHFITACHDRGLRFQYYGLSVSNVERLHKALGRRSEGIVVTQVMPAVASSSLPVVRDYRAAIAGQDAGGSAFGLEGYISGRMIVEALRAAGPQLTRARFAAALEKPASSQVGGFPVSWQGDARNGSPFVELAMIGSNGRLLQ